MLRVNGKIMAMWKTIGVVYLLFNIIFTANAHNLLSTESQLKISNESQKYVIFDTDMGSDDAWSLQMVLKAEKLLKNIKVLGITTVNGNTNVENVIKNTYRILDGLNRTDIPIYIGSPEAIIPVQRKDPPFFGSNGFSDVDFWEPHYPSDIKSIIQKQYAIDIIRELVLEHPHKITIIALGPLTNIALAVKAYPEIKEYVKDIFIMGGNYNGRGNIIPGAEFNFYWDAEAAFIVLNSLKSPITILPLECAQEEHLTISKDWRFNVLGNVNDRNVQLLNEVESIAFRNRSFFTPFDALLTAAFLFPEKCIRTQNRRHATVELQGIYTRGQMVIDHRNTKHNVNVIEVLDEEEFKKVLEWTASA